MARRNGKPLDRKSGSRQQKQRFLLYCEGAVTEGAYFKGLRSELRSKGVTIKLGNTSGEPLGLVQDAIAHQERAPRSREDGFESYDHVWCVFDVEAPRPHPTLEQALRRADADGVRCAISNPCFELWLLLHFADHPAYLTTEDACRKLEAHPCGYARPGKSLRYADVQHLCDSAIQRAQALASCNESSSPVVDRNPWTSVWQLVHELRIHA